jgi:hypothetical protein
MPSWTTVGQSVRAAPSTTGSQPRKRLNPTADGRVLDLKGALLEWCRVGDPDAEAPEYKRFEVRRHPATES